MPEEKHGYKMHMIVPKPTDPEELKKREELSNRLKEYPNEALKKALEGIQAKKEQEEREKREQEEKVSFIGILDLMTSRENLGKFSDGKFIFNEGIEKDDGNGKYIEIIEKRYYEWSEGMDGFGYRCVLRESGHYCLFCGEFKDGHILRGIQILDNGDKYVGQFKNDEREGQGIYTYANGAKYVGQFKNGKREGQGIYTGADGRKYVGQFKNDVVEGQGTFTYANGKKYVGQFKNGKREGQGTFTWPNGKKYVGQFKNDKREGQGTFTWPNGKKYVGQWKNDVKVYN